MIDAHCHLSVKKFNGKPNPLIGLIEDFKKELEFIVDSAPNPNEAKTSLELSEKHKGFIFSTLGLHPVDALKLDEKEIESYIEFLRENRNKIVGIGEVGLDYHYIKQDNEIKKSKEIFLQFIDLAKELDLPLVLHLRKAEQDGFKILVDNDVKKAMFHFFSGKKDLAIEITKEGYYISIPVIMLKSKTMKKVAKTIPLEKLITETDSPWASPFNEEFNKPTNVKYEINEIAKLRNMDEKIVEKQVTENAKNLFGMNF